MICLSRIALFTCIGATLTLSACKQGVGDRCQVTGDCSDNLICVLPAGATAEQGGKCESNNASDLAAILDFIEAPDLTPAPIDAGTVD